MNTQPTSAGQPATPAKVVRTGIPFPSDEGDVTRMTVRDYMDALYLGRPVRKAEVLKARDPLLDNLLTLADFLGLLEPAEGRRPSVGRPRTLTRRYIRVPRATSNTLAGANPDPTPGKSKVFSVCGTLKDTLIIGRMAAVPVNLTALEKGEVEYNAPLKSWKRLCPQFQGSDECPGILHTMDNMVVTPGGVFELFLLNHDPNSTALWVCEMETWLAR